jgi:K+-sensing histidine kinase KdpD
LFEPYFKTQDQASKEINKMSHGLGLYNCKKILQCFGSDLKVKSKLGQGAEFSFKLELKKIRVENCNKFRLSNLDNNLDEPPR